MFQIATSTNKLHFILLFLKVLSIIVALTIETVFSYLKDRSFLVDILSCNLFVLLMLISFTLILLLIHVKYWSNPMKGGSL